MSDGQARFLASVGVRALLAALLLVGSLWLMSLLAHAQPQPSPLVPATAADENPPAAAGPASPLERAGTADALPAPVAGEGSSVPTVASPGTGGGSGAAEGVAEPISGADDLAREFRRFRAAWHSGLLAFAVALVFFLTRFSRTSLGLRLLDRIPGRWRWTVPAGLGVLVIVLPELAAGVAWWRALADGLIAAMSAVGVHSSLVRDLLGFPSPSKAANLPA